MMYYPTLGFLTGLVVSSPLLLILCMKRAPERTPLFLYVSGPLSPVDFTAQPLARLLDTDMQEDTEITQKLSRVRVGTGEGGGTTQP